MNKSFKNTPFDTPIEALINKNALRIILKALIKF